jgi:hypothetical protein
MADLGSGPLLASLESSAVFYMIHGEGGALARREGPKFQAGADATVRVTWK